MQKNVVNSALVVLLSLGLTACSINAGGGSQGESERLRTSTVQTIVSDNTQRDDVSSGKEKVDEQRDEKSEEHTNTIQTSSDSQTDVVVPPTVSEKKLTYPTISVSESDSGVEAAKYLFSAEKQAVLLAKIEALRNVSTETCSAACNDTNVKTGDVVKAYKTSYANYAVVREAYDRENRATPTNTYIATVMEPTTDKAAVVNATYKGQASWSSSNRFNVRTEADLTLTVDNNNISGELKQTSPTSSGNYPTLMTFNHAEIKQKEGVVGFEGTVDFKPRSYNSAAKTDLNGTYQGYFAGSQAQEVIGTFQSNTQSKDAAIQGAFSATK